MFDYNYLFSFNLRILDNLRFFAFPYFDHNAFKHHSLHILDASDLTSPRLTLH